MHKLPPKTDYPEAHVRRLFARDGTLYNLWLEFQKDAMAEGVEDSITMMYGHLPDITRALIMQEKSMQPGAVRATEIIYNYTLDKLPEKSDSGDGEQEKPLDEETKERILSAFRNFGLICEDE